MKILLKVVKGPHEGKTFEFEGHDTFLVGRGAKAHFRLARDDMYFSRSHFMVEVNPPNCRILDLNSRNGTFVNRKKIQVADQYSAAATLYYLLTGKYIFEFEKASGPNGLAKRFLKILHDTPVPIHQRRAAIPDQLNFILQRALAKEPQDRFPDVGELKRSLSQFV